MGGPPLPKRWLWKPFEQARSGGDVGNELAYIPLAARGGPLPILDPKTSEKSEHCLIDLLQSNDHRIHPEKPIGRSLYPPASQPQPFLGRYRKGVPRMTGP
jgi:hypothetical protein